jgi:hypothetical protein
MATAVSTVVGNVRTVLNDSSGVRWGNSEVVAWLNEGRKELARLAYDKVFGDGTRYTHVLVAGCFQTLSVSGAFEIARVDSNVSTGRSIRLASKDQLNAFRPGWRNDTATEVQNWFPDDTNPLGFWVYPAAAGRSITVYARTTPTELGYDAPAALPSDMYISNLENYILFRAYSKEDEAGSLAKAQAAYQLFITAFAPAP